MWKWTRKSSVVLLAVVVLAVGMACTSEENLGPSTDQPSESLTSTLSATLGSLHLLSCSAQPYLATSKVIGTQGGTIVVGTHELVIPAGALAQSVTIKAEQVSGSVNSVRFSPEGLQFAKPASLTLSYQNCSPLLGVLKRVAYTDERLRILELIPSLDNLFSKDVTGSIRHFSRYAVAW